MRFDFLGEGGLDLGQLVVRRLARRGEGFDQACVHGRRRHQIVGRTALCRNQPGGLERGFKAAKLLRIRPVTQIVGDAGQRGKGSQQDGAYGNDDRACQLDFLYARAHLMRYSRWNGYGSWPFYLRRVNTSLILWAFCFNSDHADKRAVAVWKNNRLTACRQFLLYTKSESDSWQGTGLPL
ncbi:hypothetical protein D3C78_1130760 [compost metagenome]